MEPISEKIWKNLYGKHIVKQKQQDTMADPFLLGSLWYVVVSSPQCGGKYSLFSDFPLGGIYG